MSDLEDFRLKPNEPHHRFPYIASHNWEGVLLIEAIAIGDTVKSHRADKHHSV